jgi:hypothetical protein
MALVKSLHVVVQYQLLYLTLKKIYNSTYIAEYWITSLDLFLLTEHKIWGLIVFSIIGVLTIDIMYWKVDGCCNSADLILRYSIFRLSGVGLLVLISVIYILITIYLFEMMNIKLK